jgi:hypothetical protein
VLEPGTNKTVSQMAPLPYLKVAILSILISSVSVLVCIFFYTTPIYFATSDLAKNVALPNVDRARMVCLQYFLCVCFAQLTYIGPAAALASAAICSLCERYKRKGADFFNSLYLAPVVSLVVFSINPPTPFLIPFDAAIWRTFYLPASRSHMVQPLLDSVAYKGMDSAALIALLGSPDYEKTNPDASGKLGYSVGADNGKRLYFYVDKHKKVFDSKVEVNAVDWFDGGYGK